MHDSGFSTTRAVKYVSLFVVMMVAISAVFVGVNRPFKIFQEETRHQVYSESSSKIEGTNRSLTRLRLEYQTADSAHRSALRQMALTQAAEISRDNLSPEIREWISDLENN